MGSLEKLAGTQDECLCCCGLGKKRHQRLELRETVTDGPTDDEVDGGTNLKTCCCCWCMGCDQEGVYVWLKNLLLLYNFIFWLLGCGLISLGIYSEVMRQHYSEEVDHVFLTPAVVLCLIGSFSFVIATLGGVGALRDNLCMLQFFVYSILFFLVAELTCGILALVFKEPAKNLVNHYVKKGLTTYYEDQDLSDVVDYMQREFYCCGGDIYRDWEVNIYHNCTSPGPKACGVPFSCCKQAIGEININTMCGYGTIDLEMHKATEFIYVEGCTNAVLDWLFTNLDVLAGILLGVFVPQILGVLMGVIYKRTVEEMVNHYKTIRRTDEQMEMLGKRSGF